jgi:hypothetical protein
MADVVTRAIGPKSYFDETLQVSGPRSTKGSLNRRLAGLTDRRSV